MSRLSRASLALVVVSLAAPAGAPCQTRAATPAAAAPATARSSTTTLPAVQVDAAVRELSDPDYAVRERATRMLWAAGAAAEPALRAAVDGANPEVARRARFILSNLAYGITPGMPDEVIALMGRYRTGEASTKAQAAAALAEHGGPGARVLLKLCDEERDPAVRTLVADLLRRNARAMAVALIADGDAPVAGRLLAAAAGRGDELVAMDYAAFLLVHGGLDDAIAALTARSEKRAPRVPQDQPNAATAGGAQARGAPDAFPRGEPAEVAGVLALLHRANGDLAAARAAAGRSKSPEQLELNVMIEQGDWTSLARRYADRGEAVDVSQLSFAAAFHRLAGDAAGLDRFAAALDAAADRSPDGSWDAAEGLLLNGRLDAALDVMVRHGHFATAIDFAAQRLAFDEVPRLLERARVRQGAELGEVEVKAARALWFTGDADSAAKAIEASAKASEQRRDLPGLIAAVGVAYEMGLAEQARWHTVSALQVAKVIPQAAMGGGDLSEAPLVQLFERARFGNPTRAARWWRVLRLGSPREPSGITLDTLRAIDGRTMKPDVLQSLCARTTTGIAVHGADARDAHLELVADTLASAGLRDAAVEGYAHLIRVAGTTSPDRVAAALSKLAAFDVEAGRWGPAAERYHDAWSRDRTNPVPLYLSGWALAKAGDAAGAEARTSRALLLPLGDQNRRFDLYEAMLERKLADEAMRQRDVILRTAGFLSWRRSEALRRAGDDAHAAGDPARAADLWERAFLDNNSGLTKFVDPWANVSMPALVRRTRAAGFIKSGDLRAGLKEADAALAMSPGDPDGLIDVVTALDAAGHRPEADALYRRTVARYARLCAVYPNSGSLHNLYAWAAAKCRRELDLALTHARRAVELQPTNTASLDTLAETHFQRGEFAAAIAAMEKCAALEPAEPHHQEQLERFRKAAGAAGRPATVPSRG